MIIPDLDPDGYSEAALSHGTRDVGEGFIFLRAREDDPRPLRDCEAAALRKYLNLPPSNAAISVRRWAKLRIPTGQNVTILPPFFHFSYSCDFTCP